MRFGGQNPSLPPHHLIVNGSALIWNHGLSQSCLFAPGKGFLQFDFSVQHGDRLRFSLSKDGIRGSIGASPVGAFGARCESQGFSSLAQESLMA